MEAEERKTAMSHDEMQDYWETLCSFTGEDIPNEVNQLMAKIRYPRFLYKYRAVNNNNLDALRSNKLFFSKASSYDDPFDTFLHIDVDKIRQEFNSNYSSPEALAALANGMKETFQNQPANCKMNLPAMIDCVPAGVIIGLRTPPVDKNLIISMAKEAGVKNIYQSYIDEKNRLNAYLLKDV